MEDRSAGWWQGDEMGHARYMHEGTRWKEIDLQIILLDTQLAVVVYIHMDCTQA